MTMQILPLCIFTYMVIRYRQLRTVMVIVVVYWRGIAVRPEEMVCLESVQLYRHRHL